MPALPAEVFADGDEFHFRRNDAALRIMHLRHARAFLRAQGRAAQRRKILEASFRFLTRLVGGVEGQIAVVDGFQSPAFIFFNVTTRYDPFVTQSGQTFAHVATNRGIAVRAAGVIDTHGRILFQFAGESARWGLIDFAKWNAHPGLLAFNVDAARVWKCALDL